MKPIESTLIVNTRNGFCLAPMKCKSINEAEKRGRRSCGFAYRVFVGEKLIRRGFCN